MKQKPLMILRILAVISSITIVSCYVAKQATPAKPAAEPILLSGSKSYTGLPAAPAQPRLLLSGTKSGVLLGPVTDDKPIVPFALPPMLMMGTKSGPIDADLELQLSPAPVEPAKP
jgi:hypothetical protein